MSWNRPVTVLPTVKHYFSDWWRMQEKLLPKGCAESVLHMCAQWLDIVPLRIAQAQDEAATLIKQQVTRHCSASHTCTAKVGSCGDGENTCHTDSNMGNSEKWLGEGLSWPLRASKEPLFLPPNSVNKTICATAERVHHWKLFYTSITWGILDCDFTQSGYNF